MGQESLNHVRKGRESFSCLKEIFRRGNFIEEIDLVRFKTCKDETQ